MKGDSIESLNVFSDSYASILSVNASFAHRSSEQVSISLTRTFKLSAFFVRSDMWFFRMILSMTILRFLLAKMNLSRNLSAKIPATKPDKIKTMGVLKSINFPHLPQLIDRSFIPIARGSTLT